MVIVSSVQGEDVAMSVSFPVQQQAGMPTISLISVATSPEEKINPACETVARYPDFSYPRFGTDLIKAPLNQQAH